MLVLLESYWVGAWGILVLGSGVLLVYIFKTFFIEKMLVQNPSLSLFTFYLHFSNAVYYYSLPLLRSDLVSVHLQLDRQHRSIQVGHVS